MTDLRRPEHWRPSAFTAIADRSRAKRIVDALHRQGFLVHEHPTGFHLVSALADLIEGRATPCPQLIVADVRSAGCSGATIANGLRDLGIEIPVILIGDADPAPSVFVVDDSTAITRVPELARRWAPIRLLERRREPERLQA